MVWCHQISPSSLTKAIIYLPIFPLGSHISSSSINSPIWPIWQWDLYIAWPQRQPAGHLILFWSHLSHLYHSYNILPLTCMHAYSASACEKLVEKLLSTESRIWGWVSLQWWICSSILHGILKEQLKKKNRKIISVHLRYFHAGLAVQLCITEHGHSTVVEYMQEHLWLIKQEHKEMHQWSYPKVSFWGPGRWYWVAQGIWHNNWSCNRTWVSVCGCKCKWHSGKQYALESRYPFYKCHKTSHTWRLWAQSLPPWEWAILSCLSWALCYAAGRGQSFWVAGGAAWPLVDQKSQLDSLWESARQRAMWGAGCNHFHSG